MVAGQIPVAPLKRPSTGSVGSAGSSGHGGQRAAFRQDPALGSTALGNTVNTKAAWSEGGTGAERGTGTSRQSKGGMNEVETVSKVINALAASSAESQTTIDRWSSNLKAEVAERVEQMVINLQKENEALWQRVAFDLGTAHFGNHVGEKGDLVDWQAFNFPKPPMVSPPASRPEEAKPFGQGKTVKEPDQAEHTSELVEGSAAALAAAAPEVRIVPPPPEPLLPGVPPDLPISLATAEPGDVQKSDTECQVSTASSNYQLYSGRKSSEPVPDSRDGDNAGVEMTAETESALSSCTPVTEIPSDHHSDVDKQFHKAHNAKIRQTMVALKRCDFSDTSSERTTRNSYLRSHMVFADSTEMKERVRQALSKPEYNVCDLYSDTGICSAIAKSVFFENLSLFVITVNAGWIAYDTDHNQDVILSQAAPIFQIAEHVFCAYFVLEWTIRFGAFRVKAEGLKDRWFLFDTLLVSMMVFETWLMHTMFILLSEAFGLTLAGGRDASILKLFRMVRMTRMARMMRILRAMPELMILLKGLCVASRSVFFTLLLLFILIYIFAIAFRQLTADLPIGEKYFSSVPTAITSLLLRGTLPDLADLVYDVADQHLALAVFLFMFILLATLTVMNMLVGVLVEVVKVVSTVEKEELTVTFVRSKLLDIIKEEHLDLDGNGMLSREEFLGVLTNVDCARFIQECGVDVVGLVEFTELIFKDQPEILLLDFVELVLQLRGSNTATVKDIVDARKFMMQEMRDVLREVKSSLTEETMQVRSFLERRGSKSGSVSSAGSPGTVAPALGGGSQPLLQLVGGASSTLQVPRRLTLDDDVGVMAPSSLPISQPPLPGGPAPLGVLTRTRRVAFVSSSSARGAEPGVAADWMAPPAMEGLSIIRRPQLSSRAAPYMWDDV